MIIKYDIRKDGFILKDWLKEQWIYVLFAAIFGLGGLYYFFNNQTEASPISSVNGMEDSFPNEVETPQQPSIQEPEKIIVDVKGQVKMPGVYQSSHGERVIDVINRSGGLTENADESQVNFAEHVQDAMVIYIPAKGEDGLAVPSGSVTQNDSSDKININKANETQLQEIPGIGPAKASAIIEYRELNGSFKSIDDIKNITGIGDKTFEKLKDSISVK
jgi:competence protein ComEA